MRLEQVPGMEKFFFSFHLFSEELLNSSCRNLLKAFHKVSLQADNSLQNPIGSASGCTGSNLCTGSSFFSRWNEKNRKVCLGIPFHISLLSAAEIGQAEEQLHDPFLLVGITLLSVAFKTVNGIGLLSLLYEYVSVIPILVF